MIEQIRSQISETFKKIGIQDAELTTPPKPDMGDFAFPCFQIAKKESKNPAEIATELSERLNELFTKEDMRQSSLVSEVRAFGPYVNFFLDNKEFAIYVLSGIEESGGNYGKLDVGKNKKVVVEFGCPNPLKVFHLGHLKNLITGDSVVRIFENAGYEVVRVNYQGDVGMHIAKALYGLSALDGQSFDEILQKMKEMENKPLPERVEFLGSAYARGAKHFDSDDEGKADVVEYNKKVYSADPEIQEVYNLARQWSLDYFDTIYQRLGSRFDQLYFESQVFERGKELVEIGLEKGIFKKSDGAVIFEGSKHGLHDRVFINSQGYPTYEGKDMGLGEMHFEDHNPDMVVHVVGKEQTGYFQVVFKALEHLFPNTKDKEYHLPGGYLQLKGEKKMSSRTGNVVSGEELLAQVESGVRDIMKENELENKDEVVEKVSQAVLKYAMLKSDVTQDVAFDMEESITFSGDSGPYLLYIVARIKSILRKAQGVEDKMTSDFRLQTSDSVNSEEKQLLLQLAQYPEVTRDAVDQYDPSKIAKYIFDLAQLFNAFYHACPVLQAADELRSFRLQLIQAVGQVMESGLNLLGIEVVGEM